MSDINLLPENLRDEETKELAAHKPSAAAPAYHFFNQADKSAAAPAVAPSLDSVKEVPKAAAYNLKEPIKEVKIPSQLLAFKAKSKKGAGIWAKLFQKKEKVAAQPKEQILSKTNQSPLKDINNQSVANQNEKPLLEQKILQPGPASIIFGKEIDVNFLPEGINLVPIKKLRLYFGLSAIIGVIIVALGYFGINLSNQLLEKQFQGIDRQLEAAEAGYAKLKAKEEEALKWSKRVAVISSLLENHIYWSKFFPYLEKTTIPDVYYTSIGLSSDGIVTLSGVATNYTAVARQYKVFLNNSEIFPEATLSFSGGAQGEGIGLSVKLKLDDKLYYSLEKQGD